MPEIKNNSTTQDTETPGGSNPEQNSKTRDSLLFERSLLQTILGTTALVSAALLYISWLYHRRYFEAFGLFANMISYEARDYILNAKSALVVNAIVVASVILSRFLIDFRNRKVSLTIALLNSLGFLSVIIYLVSNMWDWGNTFGINVVGYRSAWVMLVFISILLLYSAIAPTFIYRRLVQSKKHNKIADTIAWSSLLVSGFLIISLSSSFIGSFEGKHDASVTSRKPIVTVSTEHPIGIDIQPDFIVRDAEDNDIYFYYNLRLLGQEEGTIYVFRPGKNINSSLVYMVEMPNVHSVSLGWSVPSTPTIKAQSIYTPVVTPP